jgi:hypothetical protein
LDDDYWNYHEPEVEEKPQEDKYFEAAKEDIEGLIAEHRVVTERELKVRLENKYFPWVTNRALDALVNSGRVIPQGLSGRPGRLETKKFFSLPNFAYDDIVGDMRQKKVISKEINAQLTGHAPATYYAEDLFERAFQAIGFEILGRNASEYKGRKVNGISGKEPPNLDFIIRRDKVVYGVDIKNWIRYEYVTRREVEFKFELAKQLNIIPFIIARYIDKSFVFQGIIERGGICYPYKDLILSPYADRLARAANQVLGYPVIALDRLPTYKIERILFIHNRFLQRKS